MPSSIRSIVIAAVSVMTPVAVAVAQSSVAVSPFVSYIPSAVTNPLVGMSLTFGGTTGLALRGSADMSISTPRTNAADAGASTGGTRPWAGDADVVLFLNGLGGGATMFSQTLAPYLFSGISLFGGDSAGVNVVNNGWSYGAGATIPLGLDADLFGEARWRMSKYVLPTSHMAPDSKSELRVGLSFHVGGSRESDRPVPRRRHARYDEDDYVDAEPVVTQAAPVIVQAPAPVIVQAPAPVIVQSQPQTVVVAPPQRVTNINLNIPVWGRRSGHRVVQRVDTVVVTRPRVLRRTRR